MEIKLKYLFQVLKSSNRPKSSALSITTRSTALDLLTTTTRFLVDEKNLVVSNIK